MANIDLLKQRVPFIDYMIEYWENYVKTFNPKVEVKVEVDRVRFHGVEKRYQNQYGRDAPKELGEYPSAGQDSHYTNLFMVFCKGAISLNFWDSSPISPTLTQPGEWSQRVQVFADQYGLNVQKIIDEDSHKNAILTPPAKAPR